jgi:hypothetical protein
MTRAFFILGPHNHHPATEFAMAYALALGRGDARILVDRPPGDPGDRADDLGDRAEAAAGGPINP